MRPEIRRDWQVGCQEMHYCSPEEIASGSIGSEPTRKPIAPSSVNKTATVTASMFGAPGKAIMIFSRCLAWLTVLRGGY